MEPCIETAGRLRWLALTARYNGDSERAVRLAQRPQTADTPAYSRRVPFIKI